jgi:hypothetical protein
MKPRQVVILACIISFLSLAAGSASRPYQGDGACLSCHQRELAALPSRPCMDCHYGNMRFLEGHGATTRWPETSAMAAMAGGGLLLCLGVIGLVFVRKRTVPALGLMVVIAAGAVQEPAVRDRALWEGAFMAARGGACDLFARFAPGGSAFLFASRGPDTDGDDRVDLRDGQALFLWRKGWTSPKRVTSYCLDFGAAMAAWSADGKMYVVPCPLKDTDTDGRVGIGDRHALLLFDADGRRLATASIEDQDCLSPQFSWDGSKVAFIAGQDVYEWNHVTGAIRLIDSSPGGLFPRMAGWPRFLRGPVYWEGRDYVHLSRDKKGRYVFPEDAPVVSAGTNRRIVGGPLRRIKAAAARDAVFYMAQPPGGKVGLRSWNGEREEPVSPPGRWIYVYEPCADGVCWSWSSDHAGGSASLERYRGMERPLRIEMGAAPSLLGLAARDGGGAVVSCRWKGMHSNGLVVVDGNGIRWTSSGKGAWFRPTAGGDAIAAVQVAEDTDGDGALTPLDQGELWVSWEGP